MPVPNLDHNFGGNDDNSTMKSSERRLVGSIKDTSVLKLKSMEHSHQAKDYDASKSSISRH